MGYFSNVGNANVSGDSAYFEPGDYEVTVERVKLVESGQGKGMLFIIEARVKESTNDKLAAGTLCAQILKLSDQLMTPIHIKSFVCAVTGVDAANDDDAVAKVQDWWSGQFGQLMSFEDICDFIVADDNPLEGYEMLLSCVMKKTKKGGDYTKHLWHPVELDA